MRVTIDASLLAKELALVGRVIDKRTGTSLPVLGHVLLQAVGDRLTLSATDMIIAMRTAVAAQVQVAGDVLVPADVFGRLVQTWDGSVDLSSAKGDRVDLGCGSSKAKLPSLAVADYPTLTTTDKDGFAIDGPQLVALLRRTVYIARREETQSPASGYSYIRLTIAGGVLGVAATDGKRVAYATAPVEAKDDVTALLPAKLGQLLIDLSERLTGVVYFRAEKDRLYFWSGDLRLSSTVPYGHFPDVERVTKVPADYSQLDVPKADLAAALKRLAFIDPGGGVSCTIERGAVKLSARSHDHGEAEEVVETDSKVSVPTTGFGLDFLTSFLATVGTEHVTLAMGKDTEKPSHLWPAGKSSEHHYVVAPRRP